MTWNSRIHVWGVPATGAVLVALVLPTLTMPATWILPLAVLLGLALLTQLVAPMLLNRVAGGVVISSHRPFLAFLFAGIFLLPPGPFVILVVVPHLVDWAQEYWSPGVGRRLVSNHSFQLITHTIAGLITGALYQLLLASAGGTASPLPLLAMLCAITIYTALQQSLNGAALVLARGLTWQATGALRADNLLPDVLTCSLGAAAALLWDLNPWLILLVFTPLVLIDRALRVPQLKHEARTDSKTGLLNARAFGELFVREMERAERSGRPLGLVMADLDFLRNTNNTYGHLAGDAVLAEIGRTINESIREYDVAGRFGGEEFAIVLPDTDQSAALAIAERLRHAVATRAIDVPGSQTAISVTMSLGLACFPEDATTTDELTHAADVAVYQAKLQGRNCVVCASEVPHFVKLQSVPGLTPRDGAGRMADAPASPLTGAPLAVDRAPSAVTAAPGLPGTRVPLPEAERAPAGHDGASNGAIPSAAPPARPAEAPTPAAAPAATPVPFHVALFVGVVITTAVVTTLAGLIWGAPPDYVAIGVFAGLTALFEVLQVNVYGDNTASVATATIFAAALLGGIPGAAIAAAAAALTHYVRMRPALYRAAFNWSTHLLAGTVPALVIAALGLRPEVSNLPLLIIPMAVAALIYFVLDTGLVACAIGLSTATPILPRWHKQFEWLAGHYLVLGVIGLFLDIAYTALGSAGVLVFTLPVLMMRQAQQQYVERTRESMQELKRMNVELAQANREVVSASQAIQLLNDELFLTLAKILDARDPYVGGHAAQVSTYATAIAREMGLPAEQIELVRQAGFLHDIGKIAISEQVLHKPARLTDEEYEYVKTHAAIGAALLETSRALRHLAPFVRGHHERWDGHGYPDGLRGSDIPLEARILAVCDAVEAMASDRPYQRGKSLPEVIAEVQRCAGSHFDPVVAETFVRLATRDGAGFVINSAREVTRKQTDAADLYLPGTAWLLNPPNDIAATIPASLAAHVKMPVPAERKAPAEAPREVPAGQD